MSDAFPAGNPPPLTGATYSACYSSLAHLIDQETPIPHQGGKEQMPLPTRHDTLAPILANLDHWHTYAADGEPVLLGTLAPWTMIDEQRATLGSLADDLTSRIGDLDGWDSDAGRDMKAYLTVIRGKVAAYASVSPGNDQIGCLIEQVNGLLKAAFTALAAYKKDLFQIAKTAHDTMLAIDHGGPSWHDVEMLMMVIAGISLNAATGQVAGLAWPKKIFGSAASIVVGKAGEMTFAAGEKGLTAGIGGDLPKEIMETATKAVNDAVGKYRTACLDVSAKMGEVWTELNNQYTAVQKMKIGEVPRVDTSANPTFAPSAYGLQ